MEGLGNNRVFLITGGAGGIGQATAKVLAKAGARVVITDIDAQAGEAAVQALSKETGATLRFEALDVTDDKAVEALAQKLEADQWPVYGVMANAGIAPSSAASDYPAELWRKTVDINLNGVFWTTQAFGKRMLARGEGAVLITSSIAGSRVVSPERHAAYGATKAAVAHLARLLGVEWAPHVRVNAIAPGYTATTILDRLKEEAPDVFKQWLSRTPAGRLNSPEEVANAAAFLLSDLASGITGTVLNVDGGYSAR